NNPIKYTDPNGRDIELSTSGGNYSRMKEIMIQTLMRPGGRADLTAVANDHNFIMHVRNGRITSEAKIQFDLKNKGKADVTFGKTTPTIAVANNKVQITGVDTVIDTQRIGTYHADQSGMTTMAHELNHVQAFRTGGNAQAG